jgi:hypothetical protein
MSAVLASLLQLSAGRKSEWPLQEIAEAKMGLNYPGASGR